MSNISSIITEWVELYSEELINWAYFKLADNEIAKDLVQDTFIAAYEKGESFKKQSSPKTWLFSILNHKIIDFYRKEFKNVRFDDISINQFFNENGNWKEPQIEIFTTDHDNRLAESVKLIVEKCLANLPGNWSRIIRLRYLLDEKSTKICQDFNLSPSNFWQIMHRAKLNLRKCINSQLN